MKRQEDKRQERAGWLPQLQSELHGGMDQSQYRHCRPRPPTHPPTRPPTHPHPRRTHPRRTCEEVGRVDGPRRGAIDCIKDIPQPQVCQSLQRSPRHAAPHAAALHHQAQLERVAAGARGAAGQCPLAQQLQGGVVHRHGDLLLPLDGLLRGLGAAGGCTAPGEAVPGALLLAGRLHLHICCHAIPKVSCCLLTFPVQAVGGCCGGGGCRSAAAPSQPAVQAKAAGGGRRGRRRCGGIWLLLLPRLLPLLLLLLLLPGLVS